MLWNAANVFPVIAYGVIAINSHFLTSLSFLFLKMYITENSSLSCSWESANPRCHEDLIGKGKVKLYIWLLQSTDKKNNNKKKTSPHRQQLHMFLKPVYGSCPPYKSLWISCRNANVSQWVLQRCQKNCHYRKLCNTFWQIRIESSTALC